MRTRAFWSVMPVAVAVAVLTLAGCGDEGGTAMPTASSAAPSPVSSAPQATGPAPSGALTGVVACQLLTADELKRFDITKPGRDRGLLGGTGTNSCQWQRPHESGSGGVTMSIAIRPAQGIASVVLKPGWTKESGDFGEGKRPAVLLKDEESGGQCMMALGVGPTSRVDVSATSGSNTKLACDTVSDVATIIEPKLPKDGG